ncbi:MAG TPA: PKD domain-containing protein, partial [Puia sp.]|nr:PKD domain-containing protein [Puia sp.]
TVSRSNYISIWKKNSYDFKASATDVCGNTVIFFDAAPEDPEMIYWSWDFGDNAGYIPTGPHITHTYASPGIYTVKLYITGVACSSVVTKEQYITVEDLSTKISGLTNTCNGSRGEVSFTQESVNALGLVWDFGDGATLNTGPDQLTVKHEYKKSGSYPVKLTASNGQCTQTYQTTAYVLLKQDPVLTARSTQVCINDQVPIQISGLETNPSPFPYSYPYNLQKLIYPDGTSFDGSRNDNWLYDGSQYNGSLYGFQREEETVRAIVIPSFFNCPDTSNFITVKIKGSGATAGFETSSDNACFSSRVEFRDTSKTVTGTPVQNWLWDFGDGQTLVSDKGGTVSHTYQSPGIYYATLKVSDAGGCSSATPNYAHGITVAGPLAAFSSSGTSVPLNSSVYFYNNTNDYGSAGTIYTWDFGDQSPISNAFSPSHTYPVAGSYTVTLTATNPISSCSSTAKQEIVVKNFNTAFGFTTSYIAGACPPALVSFRNTSVNYTRVTWDFGD